MPPRLDVEPTEQVLVRMDADLHRRLKLAAKEEERTMAQQVRMLVRQWLDSRAALAAADRKEETRGE